MTVSIDTAGPGVEGWRSEKFTATVNTTAAYVYDYARQATQNISVWSSDDSPAQSWFNYGADEETTVVVSLADVTEEITSAIVYPGNAGVTQVISGSTLTLTVPVNVRLRVEVNGDRAECLHIFSSPLLTAPAAKTDYTTLGVTTTLSTPNGANSVFTAAGHGFADQQKVLIKSTTTRPSDAGGVLAQYEAYYVDLIDVNSFSLGTTTSGADLILTDNGSGTITVTTCEWTDTVNALYFPAGEHDMGRRIAVGDDTTIYLEAGAVVTGSFDLENATGATIKGPGLITGLYNTWEEVRALDSSLRAGYSIFNDAFADPYGDNSIIGITAVATPYYFAHAAGSLYQNVHCISCWTGNTDGIRPAPISSADRTAIVKDCFLFVGDDVYRTEHNVSNRLFTGCFGITTANGIFHGPYFSNSAENDDYSAAVRDCHAMHLGREDGDTESLPTYANCIIRSFSDGDPEDAELGHHNVIIDGVHVWGEMNCRLFALGNVPYIWQSDPPKQGYGQIKDWTISNITTEQVPLQLSEIVGIDEDRKPSNLDFTGGVTIAGTKVTIWNYETFFTVSEFAENVTFEDPSAGAGVHLATDKHQQGINPFPPGFNYPNHVVEPTLYQSFEGPSLTGRNPSIGLSTSLGLKLHEYHGETIYIAGCAVEDSSVGHREVFSDAGGGTSYGWLDPNQLNSWSAGESNGCFQRYCDVLKSIKLGFAAQDDTGECIAIVYAGGETDAEHEELANNFYRAGKRLVGSMREKVKEEELCTGAATSIPVIWPKIRTQGTYAETVNLAIERIVNEDAKARTAVVSDLVMMSDDESYDGASMSTLGERVYNELIDLGVESVSKLDLCNMALTNIGDSGTITSIDPPDASLQARLCALHWGPAVKEALRRHEWAFATRSVSPTAMTSDRTDWCYSYVKPWDIAGVVAVLPKGSTNDEASVRFAEETDANHVQRIYTDEPDAIVRYVSKSTDPAQWSDEFLTALPWLLGSKIAPGLIKGSAGMGAARDALQMFEHMLAQSAGFDSDKTRENEGEGDDLDFYNV